MNNGYGIKRIITFVLVLCAFGAVLPGSSVVKAAGGTIQGTVRDEDAGGTPIQGISVMVDRGDGVFVVDVTDASGAYQLVGVNAGDRNVVVARGTAGGGTAADEQYAMAHDYTVPVTDGGTTTRDFSLTKHMGTIQVTLTGTAVCKANIDIVVDSTQNTAYGIGKTNASGVATITRVRPGSSVYVTTLQSGDCNQTQVGPKTVSDGQTTNVSIAQTSGGYLLYGRVQDDGGAVVDGATVWVNPSAGYTGNVCNTTTGSPQAAGHFGCTLQPSTYDVHISGVAGYPNYIQYEVVVAKDPTTAIFTLLRGNVDLEGTVQNVAGEPIVGARVQPFKHVNPGNWGDELTDSSGEYAVPDLTAGEYQIFVEAAGYQGTDKTLDLVDGTNVVDFTLLKDTELLLVVPSHTFFLGEVDAPTVTTLKFSTLNGGATGSADWTSASISVAPSNIMTVTTPSGSEGDPVIVLADPRGLTVGQTYTGSLTVVGAGDAGTRQVTIEMLVVQDIHDLFLPTIQMNNNQ